MVKAWLRKTLLRLPGEHRRHPDGALYLYRDGTGARTLLVSLLGVAPTALDDILDRTAGQFGDSFRLVYLTDSEDFSPYLRRGAIFEYLPGRLQRRLHADRLNWAAYLDERWRFLITKWQPVQVVVFGETPEAVIAGMDGPTR